MTALKKLSLTTAVAAVATLSPVGLASSGTDLTITNACAQSGKEGEIGGEYGSCAPKPEWDCVHGDITIPDKCDPNDTGCL